MQMNALHMKQVSHVGSQPIAGGDDQKCRRRVGSRSRERENNVLGKMCRVG